MYDQDIVRRVMNGDSEAYSRMYEDCAPAVYRRAFELLQDHASAREAVRKTFLDIYHSVSQLRQTSDFDEWVYRLVNFHAERLKKPDKIWDQPDLKVVWEDLKDLVNIEEKEDLAVEPESDADDQWKPIIFPPDVEDASLDGAGPMPWDYEQKKSSDKPQQNGFSDGNQHSLPQSGENTISRQENAGDVLAGYGELSQADSEKEPVKSQEDLVLPPPPPEFKGLGRSGRRSRRVRYESAKAHTTKYTIERVPYDYFPYDDASQEAYDRIELEESPKAVYESVPYRYHKNPEGNAVQNIPYYRESPSNIVQLPLNKDQSKDLNKDVHQDDRGFTEGFFDEDPVDEDFRGAKSSKDKKRRTQKNKKRKTQHDHDGQIPQVQDAVTGDEPDNGRLNAGLVDGGAVFDDGGAANIVDYQRVVEVDELEGAQIVSEFNGAQIVDDDSLKNSAVDVAQSDATMVTVVDEKSIEPKTPEKKKKKWAAGAGFFIGVIAILGALIYFGFKYGIL